VNSKIFQNVQLPGISCIRVVSGVAAAIVISMAALSPTCVAQTASVVVPTPPADIAAAASIPGAQSSISRVAAGAETLHVIVGHSLFLNTKLRLRRVYVADPAILNSITLTPNQIIVTAMTPGVSSLILLDEAGQAQSYVVSSDLDIQGMRSAISDAMKENTVNVEASGDRVILSGNVATKELADTAVKLATMYTKDVANSMNVVPEHPKQVRLKVRILEVDRSKLNQLGINLFNPGGNTSFLASTTTSQFPSTSTLSPPTTANTIGTLTTSNPLNFLLYSAKLNLGATVQDLENKSILQILAEPTITTVSGQKAEFLSGGEFPFPVIQPGGGSGSTASVTIQFKPYGVKLEFTPTVNEDGTIRLKVAPEVSALDYTNTVTISGYTIPSISTRKADTEVELRSNQSFAISGLLDQRTTDLYNKTPGAASIPIIGALFKSKSITHSTTELIVIITPTLVDPLTETAEPIEPGLPIPTLNTNNFDQSLGSHRNPNPTPPPIHTSQPSFNNQGVTSDTPATNTPAAGAAQDVAPTQIPQGAPANSPANDTVISGTATASNVAPKQVSQPAAAPSQLSPSSIAPSQSSGVAMREDVTASTVAPKLFPNSQVPSRYVFDNPAGSQTANSPPVQPADIPGPAMVQIVALSHKEDADAMVTALKRHGYDVSISQDPRDTLLHLEVGPFTNKNDAEAMRQRLLVDGYNATVK
jgi:pilus assembly protein CpaC